MSETPEFGIGGILATSSASLSVNENIDNDMENKENVAITSTASPSNIPNIQEVGSGHPLERKRSTVMNCLKEIINKDEKKEDEIDILRKINDNLEKLTDIQRMRLKLRQM
ncbi:hypothetical protein FQA39_LY02527 [Lamprigera yunnana]|nr:hypothetical protein FQA39_LY02527 [Lamprigera yunnana]